MGCCNGLKNDIIMSKELFVNIDSRQIEDYLGTNGDFFGAPSKMKLRKSSSKTVKTSDQSPIRQKKRKNSENFHNQKTKDIARTLRLITYEEVQNIRKFFVLK